MKKIIFILVLTLSCSMIFAQDALFKKYSNTNGVSTVYISKALLGMMPKMDAGNRDISKIAGKLDRLQVLSCERPSLIQSIRNSAMAYYNKYRYAELMNVNQDGELTIIYGKFHGHGKNEFVLLSIEKEEINIINIYGNVTLNDIKQIANQHK